MRVFPLFMLYFRGLIIYLRIKISGGICKSIPRVDKNLSFKYPPHKGIYIGENCFFGPNVMIEVPYYAKLKIGSNASFASNTVISSETSIDIGDNCLFAEFISIRDAEHSYRKNLLIKQQELLSDKVIIESDVWIGRGVCVLMGCKISQGSIIGANSLIKNKTTKPYAIYVGIPAREIGERY